MKTTTRLISIITVLALLAACTPVQTVLPPTATPIPPLISTSTPLPAPTQTPEPEPTLTAKVEIPIEQLPATIAAATDFANAMTAAGTPITPEQVLQQGLATKEITGVDGKKYEIASTQDGYPLMIKMEGGHWENINLINFPQINGVQVRIQFEGGIFDNSSLQQLVQKQVDSAVVDYNTYWAQLEPKLGIYDYSGPEGFSRAANALGLRDLTLASCVYPTQEFSSPQYLNGLTSTELTEALSNHVTKFMELAKD